MKGAKTTLTVTSLIFTPLFLLYIHYMEAWLMPVQLHQPSLAPVTEAPVDKPKKHHFKRLDETNCPPNRTKPVVDDILCMVPPSFLSNYKNPCWLSQVSDRLRCLPYFHLIGMDKSGSTDMFERLVRHPHILGNTGVRQKEPSWWSWRRYGFRLGHARSTKLFFEDYLRFFDRSVATIEMTMDNKTHYHPYITGDGTPMDMWDFRGWPHIPQNKALKEPKILTPHLIKHINPKVKMIVVLRNPVDRLYSDYFFINLGVPHKSPQTFDTAVRNAIQILNACMASHSLRWCLYDMDVHTRLNINTRIHLGFYTVFLEEWLAVFPREQFFIFRTEDYSKNISKTMQQLFQFLEVDNLSLEELQRYKIASPEHVYQTARKKKASSMLSSTRKILQDLYQPFNDRLAEILNDSAYTWKDKT